MYSVCLVGASVSLDADALPHAHALSLVNEECVRFDFYVLFQVELSAEKCFHRIVGLRQTCLKSENR